MNNTPIKYLIVVVFILALTLSLSAQDQRVMPQWWFGGGVGANFNWHSTDIKKLNNDPLLQFSTPFEKASRVGLWLAPLLEYRPDPVWGGMVTLGFDGRGASFTDMTDTSGVHTLSTSMNYISLEPSLRISPFEYPLYFFVGPRLGFNVAKTFEHTANNIQTTGEWTTIHGAVISAQIGVGYDIPLNSRDADWLTDLSPFIALHFGQGPRSEESWSLTSLRVGAALKFGNTSLIKKQIEHDVQFSVRSPQLIPTERRVKETLPMRNYVFFDAGSTKIPSRYVQLSSDDAAKFKEASLVQPQPKDLTGRSRRQLTVYYNVLNILGDRLRNNPSATIKLAGASLQGDGKAMAEAVKQYLVGTFGIDAGKIATTGSTKPENPSFQAGGTRELDLVKAEDSRVDVTSSSSEILMPVQIV